MIFKKRQREIITQTLRAYKMTVVCEGYPDHKYDFTNVVARNAIEAADKMKRFVAARANFSGMEPAQVLTRLSAINVTEVA
jgi:hypothetical protein